LFYLDRSQIFRAKDLERLGWLDHGFGTRLSLPDPAAAETATAKQIHSDRVLAANRAGDLGEGDALISNRAGLTLAIRTADCLPILIADPRNRAIAAVHAGWRGAADNIAAKAVLALTEQFGSRPEELLVAIGPGIGACCFEVGAEVAARFVSFFPERTDLDGQTKIDLPETIRRQLSRNGVTLGQIVTAGLCTCCQADTFHSYRRDREAAGRMTSTIRIRESR
jgi:polyphenol oxidase